MATQSEELTGHYVNMQGIGNRNDQQNGQPIDELIDHWVDLLADGRLLF